MKKTILRSIVCVGMLLCMVGCSAGDNGSNENNTELTGNMEEGSTSTTASDSQTEVENEIESSQTEDETEQEAEQDVETSDGVIGGDTVTENPDAEDAGAEVLQEEPEVEMVDFETWAKQEGNEEVCLVVWNETTKTQKIIEEMETYVIQEGDRFAVPYRENIHIEIDGELVEWESLEYTELHLPPNERVEVFILVDKSDKTGILMPYFLVNE